MKQTSHARKRQHSFRPNRHPADRLAELRQAEKILRDEIEEVRQEILDRPRDLVGDEYALTIIYREHIKVDTQSLIADFGQDNKIHSESKHEPMDFVQGD